MFAHGETVTVIPRNPGAEDAHGNPIAGWGAEYDLTPCAVYDRATTAEPSQTGRSPVAEGLTVLAPTGSVIGPHDRARVRGELYEVEGFPFDWRSPLTGWQPGVQFDLSRVEG